MKRGPKSSPRARARRAQADLFTEVCSKLGPPTPGWPDLPAPTRRRVTDLLANLLREHAGRIATALREDGDER
jgi:acyl-CoA reductase-like NAD-dependent aldehyde dehydrogenase